MEPMFGRGKFQYDIFLSAGIPLPRFVRGRFCGFCHDPHSSLAGSSRICTCLKCLSNCRCTLSCHRPCVASACAGRSLERWSPSKVGLSGALVLVWEPTRRGRLGRSSSGFCCGFGPCGSRLCVVLLETAMFVFAARAAMTGLVAPRSCTGRSSH
jgi:hypothetical protein